MSNAIANASKDDESAVRTALKNSFYPGAKDESIEMVIAYCRAAGLDPMTKPVHIVPMNVKKPGSRDYEWRDVVMPGIELYRIKADRSGKYAGQDDAVFGPDVERWNMTFPQWCKITVYKMVEGSRVPYSAKVFWLESYATQGKDSDAPNAMWRKRPYGQIEKCAEAAALRKAFPEVGAQPTVDEMAGKTLLADAMPEQAAPVRSGQPRVKIMMGIAAPTPTVEAEQPAPALPPPADMDPETGEVVTAQAQEPDADLHLAIRECETMADLNRMTADIAKLKNGRREAAIAVFNARKEQIGKKG